MITALLTLVWMALWGSFDIGTALVGIAVAGLSTGIVRQLYGNRPRWPDRKPSVIRFLRLLQLGGVFIVELVRSTLSVTKEVLRPQIRVHPAIIAVPLDVTTDVQITALANLVSLTPGTLSIDVSPDRRLLYVHVLTIDDDGAETRRAIKNRLEHSVARAL